MAPRRYNREPKQSRVPEVCEAAVREGPSISEGITPPRPDAPAQLPGSQASAEEGLVARQPATAASMQACPTKVVRLGEGAPVGLKAVELPEAVTRQALLEARPHLPWQGKVELQWSFGVAMADGHLRVEHNIASFPAVSALIQTCMSSLGVERDLDPDTLNVIVRRYTRGDQGITWHRDRVDFFEELVFGCVLHTKATRGLQFRRPDAGELAPRYTVPEKSGVAFSMTGPARFDWDHGIEEIDGERISVTWRWFKASYMADTPGEHKGPKVSAMPSTSVPGRELIEEGSGSAQADGHAKVSAGQHAGDANLKERLKIQKLLREIEALQHRLDGGEEMQPNQLQKIAKRQDVERRLMELGQEV